jgi:hypothetical protein
MNIKLFIKNNKKFFKKNYEIYKNNEILVEFNGWQICHIINSYLVNVLSFKFNAKIKSYSNDSGIKNNHFLFLLKYFKWKISNYLPIRNFAIYKSFNVEKFFLPRLNFIQKLRNKNFYELTIKKIKNKTDLLDLKIQNTHIGDLIYNSYLLDFKREINIESKHFKKYLYKSLGLFVFWNDYLKSHDVKAIILTHSVYLSAINLRLAINLGIPVYSANDEIIYNFRKTNLHPWINFRYFRKIFKKLTDRQKKEAIKKSIKIVNSRISGSMKFFFDNYKISTPFQKEKNISKSRIILKSKRIKILIAAHCFFDSPHVYGRMFFSDFFDWIDYLGKMSLKTDYDWYIKSHKNYFPETRIYLEKFCKKYNKIKLLPSSISHHKIIKEGIDVALTCYGTIGWEYPFLGVPVILASTNHPYVNYKFNIQPRNLNEYDKILKSLDQNFIKACQKINKKEIYEYYFMNYLYGKKSWLLKDLNEKKYFQIIKFFRTRKVAYSNKIYKIWSDNLNKKRHDSIIGLLKNYLESNAISSNFN